MNDKHTPGPMTQGTTNAGKTCVWLGGATEPQHEMGPDASWIDCNTAANARRIAACWNACEGIPTEALEADVPGIFRQINRQEELEAQRDDLLTALQLILSADYRGYGIDYIKGCARAAIAKAEGGAA